MTDTILAKVDGILTRTLHSIESVIRSGRIIRSSGEILWATQIRVPVGTRCHILTEDAGVFPVEVVGFDRDHMFLMAERGAKGIRPDDKVVVVSGPVTVTVGNALLGRVIDAYGAVLDDGPPIVSDETWPIHGVSINPMERERISVPLDFGVCAINGMTTIGRGMRIGLFAGSGVGKSTLLGMIARHSEIDCCVIAMIGERGREVREFIEDHLGDALSRSVVVVSAADSTALARVHGAARAAALAEHFRSQGRHVLFLVDSLTRLAMAGREIGLAVGEPSATKGYPPSVFGSLAAYIERAGNGRRGEGSITGVYTVLVEADDHVGDPVADVARSVLDGHIVLSRRASEAGIYPPIDINASLSRPMLSLVQPNHGAAARRFRSLWSRYAEKQDIIDIGAYAPGRDLVLDEAIARHPAMEAFLRQESGTKVPMGVAIERLAKAVS